MDDLPYPSDESEAIGPPSWVADHPYLVFSNRGFEARFQHLVCAARTAAFRSVWDDDGSFRRTPLAYWVETETYGVVYLPAECRLIASGLTPSEARLRTEAARDQRRQ